MAIYGTVSPGNPMGFKNRIINGDFRIWQRGTSFTSVSSGQYTADRWQLSYRTAGVTIAQVNNTTYYAARLTNTDGSVQSFDFEQRIEDTSQFSNTTYTLSFYAKASTAVTLGVNIYANYGTGGSSQDTVYSNNVSLTTSRAKYTITLPFPDMSAKTIAAVGTGGSYVRTLFSITSLPASAWYEIDSVQIEPGSVATSFDYRPHATELQLCQRYYERLEAQSQFWVPNGGYLTYLVLLWRFNVPKRAAVTLSAISGVTATLDSYGAGAVSYSSAASDSGTQYSGRLNFVLPANQSLGTNVTLTNTFFQASAEL